jgi:predicted secreted protein
MPWSLGFAVFFVIWWVLLFAVLPFGVQSQKEAKSIVPGSDPGAPVFHHLGRKIIVNTVLSAILWAIANWAYITYFLDGLAR